MATRRLHLEWLLLIGAILMPIEASASFKLSSRASELVQQYKEKTVKDAQDKKDASKKAAETAKANADGKGAKDPGKAAADRDAALKQIQAEKDKKDAKDKEETLDKMEKAIQRLEALDPSRGDTSQEIQPSENSKFSPSDRSPSESNYNSPDVFENMDGPADGAPEVSASEGSSRSDSAGEFESADIQTPAATAKEMSEKPLGGNTTATDVSEGTTASEPLEPEPAKMASSRETPPSEGANSQPDLSKADEISKPSDEPPGTGDMKRAETIQAEPSTDSPKTQTPEQAEAAAAKAAATEKQVNSLKNLFSDAAKIFGEATKPENIQKPAESWKQLQDSAAKGWKNAQENLASLAKTAENVGNKVGEALGKAFEPIAKSDIGTVAKVMGEAAAKANPMTTSAVKEAYQILKDPEMYALYEVEKRFDKAAGAKGAYDDTWQSLEKSPFPQAMFKQGAEKLGHVEGMEQGMRLIKDDLVGRLSSDELTKYKSLIDNNGSAEAYLAEKFASKSNPVMDKYLSDAKTQLQPNASTEQVRSVAVENLRSDLMEQAVQDKYKSDAQEALRPRTRHDSAWNSDAPEKVAKYAAEKLSADRNTPRLAEIQKGLANKVEYELAGVKDFKPQEQTVFKDGSSDRVLYRDQAALTLKEVADMNKYGAGMFGKAPKSEPWIPKSVWDGTYQPKAAWTADKPAASVKSANATRTPAAATPTTNSAPAPRTTNNTQAVRQAPANTTKPVTPAPVKAAPAPARVAAVPVKAAPAPRTTSTAPAPRTTSTAPAPRTTSTAPAPRTTSAAPAPRTTNTAPAPRTTSTAPAPRVATAAPRVAAAPRYVPATTYYTPRQSGGRIFRGRR